MKPLFWVGVVLVVLGILSLVIPIPQSDHTGIKMGGASVNIETHHNEKVAPAISAVLIVGGVIALALGARGGRI